MCLLTKKVVDEVNDCNKISQPNRKRYIQIDYAKALGILLVVFGHVIHEIANKGIGSNFINQLNNWIYCFHMPLFFVLSGLGLYLKFQTNKTIVTLKEIKNLSKKLLIPYAVWSLIYLLISVLANAFITKKPIISLILGRIYAFITLRGAAPLWFLSALFLVNLAYLLIMKSRLFKEKPIFCHLTLLFFPFIVTIFAQNWFYMNKPILSNIYLYPIITIFRFFPSLFYVEIGYLLGYLWEKIINCCCLLKTLYLLLFSILFGILKLNIKCGMNMHTFDYNNVGVILILGILGSIGLILFCCLLPKDSSLLAFIGKNSMDIMVLHYPPIPTMRLVCVLFIKLHFGLCFGVMTIVTTTLCLLITKFFLKPIRIYFEKILK